MRPAQMCLLILAFFGCRSSDKPEKPDNLISKEKMVDILYDVFILNAAKGSSKMILEKNGIYPENYVFEKYGIDSLQFAQSNDYYGFYVDDYETIMVNVDQRISAEKKRYEMVVEKETKMKERTKDSLRKLKDTIKINTTPTMKRSQKGIDDKKSQDSSKNKATTSEIDKSIGLYSKSKSCLSLELS